MNNVLSSGDSPHMKVLLNRVYKAVEHHELKETEHVITYEFPTEDVDGTTQET